MRVTTKSSKATKSVTGVPRIPRRKRTTRRNELSQVEAFIRSSGGKPMSRATKERLERAGCNAFPDEP